MRDGSKHSTLHEAPTRKAALDFGVAKWQDKSALVKLTNPSSDMAFPCADIACIVVEDWD